MLRLLLLHVNQRFSNDQWSEITSLHTKIESQESIRTNEKNAAEFIKFTKSKLSVAEVARLMSAVGHLNLKSSIHKANASQIFANKLTVPLPIIKANVDIPLGSIIASGGVCVDPFAALASHNCEPNSTWIFEGRELRIRALQDIPAGAEITIYYEEDIEYTNRKKALLNGWKLCLDQQ
jgi:hypothetical protein